jgi:uncharacterized protein (TIGR02598 family)
MKPRFSLGFSLVETVIALGIFAFCIVVLLALFPVGLRAARSVADETVAVNMAASVFGGWQMQADKTAQLTIEGMVTNLPALDQATREAPFYLGAEGVQAPDRQTASVLMLYSVAPVGPTASTVTLSFRWPANAPTNAALQTRQFIRTFPLP